MSTNEELLERIAKLETDLKKMKEPPQPSPRAPTHDYSAGLTLPPSAMAELARAVPDATLSDIVRASPRASSGGSIIPETRSKARGAKAGG